MIIADHHKPGHFLPTDTDYKPTCAWPERCYVQWGGGGLVLAKAGSYRTAFFEAFPGDNAGGFLRGEGKTIAEAEMACFARYNKEATCAHRWGRKGYTNGGAICYHCGAFKSVFHEVHILGDWRKPLSQMENDYLDFPPRIGDARSMKYRRKIELRKKVFGVAPSAAASSW